jgi:hypothetical protein
MHPTVFLGDKAQLKARFSPFGDSNLDAMCMVCFECTQTQKLFWTHQMELLRDVGHVKSYFGLFRDGVSVGAR